MRYLLLSIGTRGDMEPFLAAGKILEAKGHDIHCAMPAQFRELVADTGFGFHPLDRRFLELLDEDSGRAIMGQQGSRLKRALGMIHLAKQSMKMQHQLISEQRAYIKQLQPDLILYHPKCIYGRAWAMQYPDRAAVISPIPCWLHPVREYPHIAIQKDLGPRMNWWSYRFINFITAGMTARFTRKFQGDFPGIKLRCSTILQFMRERERALYTISPSLFPRPPYWPNQARIIGYLERVKTDNWVPEQTLSDFIDAHKNSAAKLSFITFGSMINATPEATTRSIIKVLEKHRIPAIINTSSGGLVKIDDAPDHVYFVNNIPYDWIFPQVHNVVHHGGSGTTHTALKHGCASLIIPHIIDQFFWNRRNHDLGTGPFGIKVKKLSIASFEPLLLDLRNNESYKAKATQIAAQMKGEELSDELEF